MSPYSCYVILADADVELRFEQSGLICRISLVVCKFHAEPPRFDRVGGPAWRTMQAKQLKVTAD